LKEGVGRSERKMEFTDGMTRKILIEKTLIAVGKV
jgi:hypothetical protein